MQVTAVNTATHAISPATITNAQGYFRTPTLPPGEYQICVSGTGFASTCDPQSTPLVGPVAILNHVVQIRPGARAIIGTVTLADLRTPCFWFRPAVSPTALTAKASLRTADNKPIAGPVSGNAAGQFEPLALCPGYLRGLACVG